MQKCHLFIITNSQIHDLATLMQGRPSRRVARYRFVNNKQMAFLQNFVSQQLLFLFSKHLDTMSIQRIVSPVKQILVMIPLVKVLIF